MGVKSEVTEYMRQALAEPCPAIRWGTTPMRIEVVGGTVRSDGGDALAVVADRAGAGAAARVTMDGCC